MKNREILPFYEIYKLNPDNYAHVRIDELNFSKRLSKRLLLIGANKVSDLLKLSTNDVREIRGFGQTSIDELLKYLRQLTKDEPQEKRREVIITRELLPFIEEMKKGDLRFAHKLQLSDSSKKFLKVVKFGHDSLDYELIEECLNGSKELYDILEMFQLFIKDIELQKLRINMLKRFTKKRLSVSAKRLIYGYSNDEGVKEILTSYTTSNVNTLKEFILVNDYKILKKDFILLTFIKWCSFNVREEIEEFFSELFSNERSRIIITMRAENNTLEKVGNTVGVTRERIRQIEKKIVFKFNRWQRSNRILYKLFLDSGDEVAISITEIVEGIGHFGKVLVYLLKSCEFDDAIYDKQLDMFIADDKSLVDKIQAYVERLPDTFSEAKVQGFIAKAEEEYGYLSKMVSAAIEENYKKTGDTYHRSQLTLASLYSEVIRQYYPNGIRAYDDEEIDRFKELIKSEYGIDLKQTRRTIGALIGRIGLLCGRGTYRIGGDIPISPELAKKIYDYIETSKHPVFLTNTLFSIFEDELLEEGIDNKYYLQGVLRELYPDCWTFRRDYITKDESITSIYSSIIDYIKKLPYPVKRQDIFDAFPGVTEIVLNLSIDDPNIINFFGEYLHSSYLKLSEGDVKYLRSVIDNKLIKRELCHCVELFEHINNENPTLLSKNYIRHYFGLYSLLEYLFRDQYNFSRPFIARVDVQIERVYDVLREMVKESNKISVEEITGFARDYHFQINSILEFIDSCNETHLLINKEEVLEIGSTGVSEETARVLEQYILGEISETMPIVHLQSLNRLPKVNIPWNEWLIYSILKKWSVKLDVAPSVNQFRYAVPLVALKGQLSRDNLRNLNIDNVGSMGVVDDLSKIDELIANYIIDDLGGVRNEL